MNKHHLIFLWTCTSLVALLSACGSLELPAVEEGDEGEPGDAGAAEPNPPTTEGAEGTTAPVPSEGDEGAAPPAEGNEGAVVAPDGGTIDEGTEGFEGVEGGEEPEGTEGAEPGHPACRNPIRDCPHFAPVKCPGYWFCDTGDVCAYECGEPQCPAFMPPAPDFCMDGVIVPGGQDAMGCQLPPRCEKPQPCVDDHDCPVGSFCNACVNSGPVPVPADGAEAVPVPPPSGQCMPLPPPSGCVMDADCPEGFVCAVAPGDVTLPADGCNVPLPASACVPGVPGECPNVDIACPADAPVLCRVTADGCEICECGPNQGCPPVAMPGCEEGFVVQEFKTPDGCVHYECVPEEGCMCPMIYAPVCGSDGKTYGNGCEADCAGVKVDHQGECEPNGCACPEMWAPVCGVDGHTYGTKCEAECANVAVAYPGECQAECMCPKIFAPVCGVDGHTYGNKCEAECANAAIDHEGECVATCAVDCIKADYVCGADGVTYTCGKPEADCNHTAVVYPGKCECRIQCIVYDPVCGANGVTYGCGEAEAKCNEVPIAHDGECENVCPPVNPPPKCKPGWVPHCGPDPMGCETCKCEFKGGECLQDADCKNGGKCSNQGPNAECLPAPGCNPEEGCLGPPVCYGRCL